MHNYWWALRMSMDGAIRENETERSRSVSLMGEGETRQRIRERIMQEGNMVQSMHGALFFSVIIIRVLSFGMLPIFLYW
jgi:hypothetical protein